MLEPGSVKVGDELAYVFGNRVKQRKIVKIKRIAAEGVIILEGGSRFTHDGVPIGYCSYDIELHLLTPELREEIELKGPWC